MKGRELPVVGREVWGRPQTLPGGNPSAHPISPAQWGLYCSSNMAFLLLASAIARYLTGDTGDVVTMYGG